MPDRVYISDLAATTLSTGGPDLATGALSLTVVSNAGFPTSGTFFTVSAPTGEHITVTSGIGTTTWGGLIRGDNGTTSKIAAIPNGAVLEEVFGARDGNNFAQVGNPGLTNVRSIKKSGAAALTGDVTLTGGTNVTLTQSGNDISIAASGGGGGGSGTVTSVALTVPSDQSVSGSPVTASGTFAVTDNTQNANTVKAGPTTGSPASPGYRLLTAPDLPAATTSTQGAVTLAASTPAADGVGAVGGSTAAARADHVHPLVATFTAEVTVPDIKVTGLTGSVQASRIVGATASGAPTTGPHLVGDASLSLADGKWYVCTIAGTPGTFVSAAGSGTVTSVGLTVPGALLGVSGSPITSSGTLAVSLLTQSANTVLAGPTSGSAATPTMRALVAADLPDATTTAIGAELIDQAPPSGHPRSLTTMNRNVGNGLASVGTDGMSSSMYDQSEPTGNVVSEVSRWNADHLLFGGTNGSAAQEPNVLVEGGTIKCWYTHSAGTVDPRLAYATCTGDPTVSGNWTDHGDVLGKGASGYAGIVVHSSVLKVDGVYYCYFATDNNGNWMRSTSIDGITWATPVQVLAANAVAWSIGWNNSYVWQEGATWYAILEGQPSGGLFDNTVAQSVDGLTWTFPIANYQLTMRPGGASATTGGAWMMAPQKRGGLYHLWFHASNLNADTPTDIYHATAPDLGDHWTLTNSGSPVIGRPSGAYDQVADPCLFEWQGKTYVMYERVINSTSTFQMCIGSVGCTVAQLIDGSRAIDASANGFAPLDATGLVPPADLPLATSSTIGAVKPDNVTTTVSGGVISAVPGSTLFAGDHLHGLARWIAGGGTTFELPDLAEYIEMIFDNGSAVDQTVMTLSSDRTQIVFDTAPTAGHVLQAQYVVARI